MAVEGGEGEGICLMKSIVGKFVGLGISSCAP